MATTRQFPLRDNLLAGVDTSTPAHLLAPGQWRTQHNFRLTPTLEQLPHKVELDLKVDTTGDVLWVGVLPGSTPGYGTALALLPSKMMQKSTSAWSAVTGATALTTDATTYRRWSTALYDGRLYFINELNQLSVYDGGTVSVVANAPSGRYVCFWYDHVVVAYPTSGHFATPNTLRLSDLYNFTVWEPLATNEADHYDFVEWQQADYPFTGITGIAKLRGTLFIYTPTAIIPVSYVGLPKVIQVHEEAVITRTGNTYPWTLVALDTVHFFYDAIEANFFVFDGQQVVPIGEPVRQYMKDNLNANVAIAQKMYGYVDADNREIWWVFPSTVSTSGEFDMAVVFNYRMKRWFTASVENVHSFCSGSSITTAISVLGTGRIDALSGTIEALGLDEAGLDRVYGTGSGTLLREEITSDLSSAFASPYADPVLETPDFHYGDIRTTKECDSMVLNTTADEVEVRVDGRAYLGDSPTFPVDANATWAPTAPDAMVNFRAVSGRVLRYRFTFKDTRRATFDAFSEGVYMKAADK